MEDTLTESAAETTKDASYSLNEVAKFLDVNESTLRNWEKKFGDFLSNYRNQYNHRMFTEDDVRLLERVKYLLESGLFTLAGVKHMLANGAAQPGSSLVPQAQPVGESRPVDEEALKEEKEYKEKLLMALNSLGSELHSLRREVREDLRASLKTDIEHLKLLLFPPEKPKKGWWQLF